MNYDTATDILEYNTVSLDEWFPILRRSVLFKKGRELLDQTRRGTPQNTCMFGNTAVRNPNTACAALLTTLLTVIFCVE
jgi:hypothetical protein